MSGNLPASILARLLTLAKQRGDDYSVLLNRFALQFNEDAAKLRQWPPTQIAAAHSPATSTWRPEVLKWV